MEFKGVYTAIVTPFNNGRIDYDAYEKLIEEQIKAEVSGIVPVGTTGESPTLSHSEHQEFIDKTVEIVNGRTKIIAGTGSNSTEEAVHLSKEAARSGADAVLSVNPYYNKPTQEGLYQHFKTIAEEARIPCVLYNIPGRTCVGLEPDTLMRLAEIPNILAIKEASANLNFVSDVASRLKGRMAILSGDDSLTLPIASVGGQGVISVLSNLTPKEMVAMVKKALAGDLPGAQGEHLRLFPLMKAMFLETNPIPVKTALAMIGKVQNELRLPLTPLSQDKKEQLQTILQQYELL